jgi:hypothetical protein
LNSPPLPPELSSVERPQRLFPSSPALNPHPTSDGPDSEATPIFLPSDTPQRETPDAAILVDGQSEINIVEPEDDSAPTTEFQIFKDKVKNYSSILYKYARMEGDREITLQKIKKYTRKLRRLVDHFPETM